jgi:hypothetical protein
VIAVASLSRQARRRKPCGWPRVRAARTPRPAGERKRGSEHLGRIHQGPAPPKSGHGRDPVLPSRRRQVPGRLARRTVAWDAGQNGRCDRSVPVAWCAARPVGAGGGAGADHICQRGHRYTIARVATERTGPDLLTVVGPLPGAQVGESLRLTGRWGAATSWCTVQPVPACLRCHLASHGRGLGKGRGLGSTWRVRPG